MKLQNVISKILSYKKSKQYLIVFLFCGILLMLLPTSDDYDVVQQNEFVNEFSLEKEEQRLENILSSIRGVNRCHVLLSVSTGTESVLAEDEGKTIVINNGNHEETVTVLERYPLYQGAVVVMGGYSDANIRFDVLSAVMSYTGLGTDKITICPIEE